VRAEISSTLCDQVIFVDQAAGTSPFSDAVLVEVNWLGQGFQRRGCAQSAVGAVLIVVGLVLAQDPPQVGLVPDKGAVQEFAAASADPVGLDYSICPGLLAWPGRCSGLGSSLSDLVCSLPACSLSAELPDAAGPA